MKKSFCAVLLPVLSLASAFAADPVPLDSTKPIAISGKAAHFDFMTADPLGNRVLAAHKGAGTLEILDLQTGQPLNAVEVGDAQGVAVDDAGHRYFVGNDDAHSVVIVDSRSLAKLSEIKVDGAVDAIAYNPKNGMLYADQDNGDRIWVIDPKSGNSAATISIPGKPEVIEYDAVTNRLYQAIKDKNSVVRINPETRKVDATWSTLPVSSPHGLVVDGKNGHLFTAGSNGKLAMLDLKSGRLITTAEIATGVDQIAYDAERKLIYCACKGFISVVQITDSGLKSLGNTPSVKGSHTLAVDPASHDVWVSYSDNEHSYFQKFKSSK